MGYHMSQRDNEFFIGKDKKEACLEAIKGLHGRESIEDSSGRHFSWVDSNNFLKAETLAEAFSAWRWEIEENEKGDVVAILFQGEKLGDDGVLFEAVAPFVVAGSYIEMHGEEGCLWRWCFDGEECVEKTARIVWD